MTFSTATNLHVPNPMVLSLFSSYPDARRLRTLLTAFSLKRFAPADPALSLPTRCSFSLCHARSSARHQDPRDSAPSCSPLSTLSLGDLMRRGSKHCGFKCHMWYLYDSCIYISSLDLPPTPTQFQCECPTWNSAFPLG